ncbi:MAG: maleylpyruvate isomerase family mycothiol-dependent enzyme [Actinomycetota bacterium]
MTVEYTRHLRENGELMARAVARDLDAHVPTCPEWNVAKLTIHTGQHHRWVADAVSGGGEPPANPGKPGLRGDDLVAWFRDGWRDLADLLDESDDETPAWSWSGDNRIGFWRRRTALETLVHRWDAENATGEGSPMDPELASDGIDEMLFVFARDSSYSGPRGRSRIVTTDTPDSWTLDLEDGKVPVPTRSGEDVSAVTVGGRAEDVLLYLWGRKGADVVDVSGDEGLSASFVRWLED